MTGLEWYRSFLHICRRGTVSEAARALGLTQPAVSQHLAALESALGSKLFIRTGRRMQLTDAGKALYTRVADAVERLEQVTARAAKDKTRTVRLGAPVEFFTERMLGCLPRDSHLRYVIRPGLASHLLDELVAGTLDTVLTTKTIAVAGVSYEPVFRETFWLVGPPKLKPPKGQSLQAWLRDQSWVAHGAELPIIRRFWQQVFGRRLDVEPCLVLPDLLGLRRAVEEGWGITVLPDYLCQTACESGRLRLLLRPEKPVINDLSLAYLKENAEVVWLASIRKALQAIGLPEVQ